MRRLAAWMSIVVGWGLLIYCVAVGVEIIGRRYLGFSLQGVDEIGGYLMALVTAIGFTCALYSRAHIRIDILLPRLSRSTTLWLNVAASGSIIAFALFLLWQETTVLIHSYTLRAVAPTPLLTPLAIPQAAWVVTLLLFFFATLVYFIDVLKHALRGEADEVAKLLGTSAGQPNHQRPR
jgi:TRAP-type C4-dicarboxylate transport system permease small subunit